MDNITIGEDTKWVTGKRNVSILNRRVDEHCVSKFSKRYAVKEPKTQRVIIAF